MQLSLFTKAAGRSLEQSVFATTDLGQFHSSIPIAKLAALLPARSGHGRTPWFDNYGCIALQFLKSYLGLSDAKLLERLNTDWSLQYFCGLRLKASDWIKDEDVIWKARKLVAQHLDIEKMQGCLIEEWEAYMDQTHVGLSDATCYESYIKYPTDVDLVWASIEWLRRHIIEVCDFAGCARPRSRYTEQARRQLHYMRRRTKTYKQRRKRMRQLLYLFDKLYNQFVVLLWGGTEYQLSPQSKERMQTIHKVYAQQKEHYEYPDKPIANRIVSLHKAYVRPIVRGKQNKRVEFGAKVNTWQVDGINFIEHFNFEAFHEGNRLKQGIAFHKKNFGRLTQVGADQLYATNENRRYCSSLSIQTCFKPKGRPLQDPVKRAQQKKLRKALGTVRSTVLEGSYGNDKNHYGLNKIKARNKATEKAWIFFGMMSANAVKIGRRKQRLGSNQMARAA